jgi:hypothetical protein
VLGLPTLIAIERVVQDVVRLGQTLVVFSKRRVVELSEPGDGGIDLGITRLRWRSGSAFGGS